MKIPRILVPLFFVASCSLNAQTGWFAETAPRDDINLFDVWSTDAQHAFIVGDYGAIYATTDGGATWATQNAGTQELLMSVKFLNATTGFISGQNGAFFRTDNAGVTWTNVPTGTTETIFDFHLWDENNWILGCSGGVLRITSDAGKSWTTKPTKFSTNNICGISFANDSTGWIVGYAGRIGRTTNFGKTWVDQSPGTNNLFYSVAAATDKIVVAVGRDGMIMRTTDGGENWVDVIPFVALTSSIKDIQFVNSSIGYIVTWSSMILKTADAGATWGPQDNPGIVSFEGLHFLDTNIGYVVGWNGTILRTNDGGPLDARDAAGGMPPVAPRIAACHPNPVSTSSSAAVDVTLAQAGFASIVVCDILGREVQTVFRGFLHAGDSHHVWSPAALPPGLYYQRLRTGGSEAIRKIVVTR